MCTEIVETSDMCGCCAHQVALYENHIEPTRLQLDNKPCPELKKERVTLLNGNCNKNPVLGNGRRSGNLRGSDTGSTQSVEAGLGTSMHELVVA